MLGFFMFFIYFYKKMTIDINIRVFKSSDFLMKDGSRSYTVNIYTYIKKKQTILGKWVYKVRQDIPYISHPFYDNAYVSNDYLKTMAKQEKNRILKLLTDDTTD